MIRDIRIPITIPSIYHASKSVKIQSNGQSYIDRVQLRLLPFTVVENRR